MLVSATASVAGADPSPDRGRDQAPGQLKRTEPAPSEDEAEAGEQDDRASGDDGDGPGGQVCDGDPSGRSDGGGGANGGGETYDNTCPAGPSQNGAGDGEATGRPCAGCVGNADDKNPPGQAPSALGDGNNGYECEPRGSGRGGNNGVGVGNPAHTGCTDAPPSPASPTCPDGSAVPASGDCGAPAVCVGASCTPPQAVRVPERDTVVLGVQVTAPAPAPAATPELTAAPAPAPAPAPVAASAPTRRRVADSSLARTGGFHLGGLVEVAAVLALAGLGLTVGTRRRDANDYIDISERLGIF